MGKIKGLKYQGLCTKVKKAVEPVGENILGAVVLLFLGIMAGLASAAVPAFAEINGSSALNTSSLVAIGLEGNGATKGSSINIDFDVTDALLSKDGKYLYLSSKQDKSLYIVNLTTGGVYNFSFNNMTESLTITPQGDSIFLALLAQEHSYYWFDNREGYIAEINPYTRSLVREFRINEDPYDLITTSDGNLYVSSGSGQWTYIKSYNLTTTAEAGMAGIRQMEHIKLHPSEKYVYSANTDLSPSDIQKFSISNGTIQALYDSPYHGDYPMCGDLEISPDGTKIFTKCGHIFRSTEDQSTDMTHIGTLGDVWNSLTFDESNNIYTVNSTILRKYDYDTYEAIGGSPINGNGRFVFYKNGHLIVVTEGGNYPTKSSIQFIDMQVPISGSISGFKINDTNGNGKWDAGEKGISNWTIRLIGITGKGNDSKIIRKEVLTDATGFYSFNNLPAGRYFVIEKLKKGFVPTGSPVKRIKLAQDENSVNSNFTNRPVNSRDRIHSQREVDDYEAISRDVDKYKEDIDWD